jgi:two-component system chemotaxis sensor kinase CheA
MSDPMEAIKQTYFQECEELLLAMEEGLLALESGDANGEVINAVFRAVHSIKGSGGAFGFDNLVHFAHGFETVLDLLRSSQLEATGDVVKVMLRAGDLLADHVAAARNGTALPADVGADVSEALAALAGGTDGGSEDEAPADFEGLDFAPMQIQVLDAPPGAGWRIRFAPHAALYAHVNEPALLLRELARLGELHVTADLAKLPPLESLDPDEGYFAWDMTLSGDIAREAVDELFEFVVGHCDLGIEPLSQPAEIVPIPVLSLMPEADAVAEAPQVAGKKDTLAAEAPKQSIRVDLDKVDRLVNLVGELVITQAMLTQRVTECKIPRTSSVGNGLAELEHLLRELQESVMAIRTQPVKSVFQRMPRLVRELAAQTGKKVHLVVEGEATEVDKTVIERLGEPLTHMIRNAVDHGLETPDERTAAGKPEEGTVTLSAEHRGGRIVIEVSDDGRGIDRVRVREKAMERGLIPTGAALSDEETDNLIFMPGFSTAKEVSNISGRGVGMDVVRRNIIDLGGRIVIGSTPRQGSRFSLTLPLTLAVLDGMVVAIGDQTFVLPLTHIVESLKPKAGDIHAFGRDRNLLNVRGAYVPLVPTAAILNVTGAVAPDQGVVILVESQGTGRLALAVDAILGQRQVVIKSFEDNYRRIDGIAAATILGDGRVALILDVDGIVTRCRGQLGNDFAELRPTGS